MTRKYTIIAIIELIAICILLSAILLPGRDSDSSKSKDKDKEPETVYTTTWEYNILEDGTLELTHCTSNETAISIPEELDGRTVTSIKSRTFADINSLESLTIPKTITNIQRCGLRNSSLKEIIVAEDNPEYLSENGILYSKDKTRLIVYPNKADEKFRIPDSVTHLSSTAFDYCQYLKFLTIPASVEYINEDAIDSCYVLEHILVADANQYYASDEGVLLTKDMTTLVICPKKKQGTYIVPEQVTYIMAYAFKGCALKEVILPPGITCIESYTFAYSNLTHITIPEGVTEIEHDAFSHCTSLWEVILPDSLKEIGSGAFESCTNLKSMDYPDGYILNGGADFSGVSH